MNSFTRVLVATDFTASAAAALARAREIAAAFGASLDVLHVAPDLAAGVMSLQGFQEDLGRIQTETENAARQRIRRELTDEDRHQLSARAVVLTAPKPADAILGYARDEHVDLIVVGTHARGVVAHMLLGSVAERVVRQAHCPVLTVPAPSPPDAETEAGESRTGGSGQTPPR
jgi:nucleotide-binding universal stress UspA family protein